MTVSQRIKDHPVLSQVGVEPIFDLVWEHDAIGISLVAPDGRWLHPSPSLCDALGYPRDELEKLTWMDVTVRGDREDDKHAVEAVIRGELDRYRMLKTYIRRNETLMPATLVVVPIRDSELKVVMFISQIIEDQRSAESPPISEIQVVWDFMQRNRKQLILAWVAYTIAVGLAGEGALRWLGSVIKAVTAFGTGS
ncbi:MAG: PAS domain S-box protein [Phycisphaerales bacterium]